MAPPYGQSNNQGANDLIHRLQPAIAFVVIIFSALVAFEIFNYSTTEHALGDLLGNLQFAGIPWATILAFAFCGIDFAGIARLFTPEQGSEEPKEVWYLFGAWLLAATMNAILTWWGVSVAVTNHVTESSSVLDPQTISQVVPVFVAIMVWIIRILIIGTLSLALDRLLHPGAEQRTALQQAITPQQQRMPAPPQTVTIPTSFNSAGARHAPSPTNSRAVAAQPRTGRNSQPPAELETDILGNGRTNGYPEPTYHSLTASGRRSGDGSSGTTNGQRRF